MVSVYLYIKAAHLIAVVGWMAGLMYLPRLFVYHAEAQAGGELSETLKTMERRLLVGIMHPAMIVTWALGLAMAILAGPAVYAAGWFHAKLLCVAGITGFHVYYAIARRRFAQDRNTRSARFFKILNEAPFVLFAAIAVLVIVKPF